ncbi:Protein of unknown function [Anaplasma phagocytophilum]|uniref:Uncharacterized protein n=1 Tax=Anaplasma phagocytophilum TaxID=948 RepID=A0A098GLW9_ANAPH|nr:Protein of unknown function [Anaplasma phagocytophilum]
MLSCCVSHAIIVIIVVYICIMGSVPECVFTVYFVLF